MGQSGQWNSSWTFLVRIVTRERMESATPVRLRTFGAEESRQVDGMASFNPAEKS